MRNTAKGLASLGRGKDTMLVHMSPREVSGLQQLALATGGSLTINPHTGLPEAGWLESILPIVAGGAMTLLSGGTLAPWMAGAIAGGGTGLVTGDWEKGLMAGLGAFGGASLAGGLSQMGAAGAGETAGAAIGEAGGQAGAEAGAAGQAGAAGVAAPTSSAASAPSLSSFKSGIGQLGEKGGWGNLYKTVGPKPLMATAAPLLAAATEPDSYKEPEPVPSQYYVTRYNPGQQSAPGQPYLYGQGYEPGYWTEDPKQALGPYDPSQATNAAEYPSAYSAGNLFRKKFMAEGGSVPGQNDQMADYYRSLLGPPPESLAPPPDELNSYLANLQARARQEGQYAPPPPVQPRPPSENLAPVPVPVAPEMERPRSRGSLLRNAFSAMEGARDKALYNKNIEAIRNQTRTYDPATQTYKMAVGGLAGLPVEHPLSRYQPAPMPQEPQSMLPMPFEGGTPQTPYKKSPPVLPGQPVPGQRGGFNPGQPVTGQESGVLRSFIDSYRNQPVNGFGDEQPPAEQPAPTMWGENIIDTFGRSQPTDIGRLGVGSQPPAEQQQPSLSPIRMRRGTRGYNEMLGSRPYAAGGGISSLGSYSDGGQLMRGPGDGVSDSIPAEIQGAEPQPAALADGEFVFPARIVSEIGNGSTEAGAKTLYAIMDRIQADRKKTAMKGGIAMDTNAARHFEGLP